MKIRIDEITEKPRQLLSEEQYTAFPSLVTLQDSGECEFVSPLVVDLTVYKEYDHIRVKGVLAVTVRQHCSRCLSEYEATLHPAFTMFYTKADHTPQDEEELELTDEDLVSVAFTGDEIDFSQEIAEQVVMELPYKPLCAEECLGLCVKCGADLNVGDCGCERAPVNVRFSALKDFKVEK